MHDTIYIHLNNILFITLFKLCLRKYQRKFEKISEKKIQFKFYPDEISNDPVIRSVKWHDGFTTAPWKAFLFKNKWDINALFSLKIGCNLGSLKRWLADFCCKKNMSKLKNDDIFYLIDNGFYNGYMAALSIGDVPLARGHKTPMKGRLFKNNFTL